jgi:hypothetical protein
MKINRHGSAVWTLAQVEGEYALTAVHLTLKAKIPGADQATFEQLANKAKAGCPVSKLLKANITLEGFDTLSCFTCQSLLIGKSDSTGNQWLTRAP